MRHAELFKSDKLKFFINQNKNENEFRSCRAHCLKCTVQHGDILHGMSSLKFASFISALVTAV